ncbi:MAG: hypothetical protein PHT99_07705 [Methanoregula sp.]|nr:hypothetical protein [Methanoregula sp.]
MKTDLKPGHVLAGFAVFLTIAAMMIAGCTDATEGRQVQTATLQAVQSEHTMSTVVTGTTSVPAPQKTALQTPTSRSSSTIVTTGTPDPSEQAFPNGILIDGIHDITKGDPLVVSGRTSLSVGTDLIVKIVPVKVDKGKIVGDFGNLEKSAVTTVTGGSANGNRFIVTIETGDLPAADHIVFVSDKNDEPAGSSSEPVGITSSSVFNIIAP